MAVVLGSEGRREADLQFALFTEKYGKIYAKARSARKITSKLHPHLQVGFLARVRLVEKNEPLIIDALSAGRVSAGADDLHRLEKLLPEWHPEEDLWNGLMEQDFSWIKILQILGWDPALSVCMLCGARAPEHFSLSAQQYYCLRCSPGLAVPEDVPLFRFT